MNTVVLVVEDEPLIRMDVADALSDAGYDVIEAADADEALAILESRDDIRLIFTDIQMPGDMDGLALATLARDRWPPIEIIVTSGRFRSDDLDLPKRTVFLSKPIRRPILLREVQSLTG